MKNIMNKLIIVLGLATPSLTFAQTQTLRSITIQVVEFLSEVVLPLLFLAALTWFIWGTVQFIRNSDNQEKRKQGRVRMLLGIIALFVMVSYLGLTSVFTQTLFNQNPILPQLYEDIN
jgi:hypothetical protein